MFYVWRHRDELINMDIQFDFVVCIPCEIDKGNYIEPIFGPLFETISRPGIGMAVFNLR